MTYKLLALAALCCQVTFAVEVIAHFMVCCSRPAFCPVCCLTHTSAQVTNTYSYTQATWANDIKVAKSMGIDGFGKLSATVARLVGGAFYNETANHPYSA